MIMTAVIDQSAGSLSFAVTVSPTLDGPAGNTQLGGDHGERPAFIELQQGEDASEEMGIGCGRELLPQPVALLWIKLEMIHGRFRTRERGKGQVTATYHFITAALKRLEKVKKRLENRHRIKIIRPQQLPKALVAEARSCNRRPGNELRQLGERFETRHLVCLPA